VDGRQTAKSYFPSPSKSPGLEQSRDEKRREVLFTQPHHDILEHPIA